MLFVAILAAALQAWTPPLRVLARGAESSADRQAFLTARDQSEWAAAWREQAPDRPLPAVDWTKEMVVGVFSGTRTTAGYSVEIVGYRQDGGRMIVAYRETAPNRDAVTAQIITSPYVLAAVPRHTGEVTFDKIR